MALIHLDGFSPYAFSEEYGALAADDWWVVDVAYCEAQILNIGCALQVGGAQLNGLNSDVVFPFGLNSQCSFTDFSKTRDGISPGLAVVTTDCVIELITID